jgi:hypothetical protein
MKKQTAIEWLLDNIISEPYSQKDFKYNSDCFDKAKEIEKQQIINTFYDCKLSIIFKEPITADQYYTENYENKFNTQN